MSTMPDEVKPQPESSLISQNGQKRTDSAGTMHATPGVVNLNVMLGLVVAAGSYYYYDRHYSEQFSAWATASAAGGIAGGLVVLRGLIGEALSGKLSTRAREVITGMLSHRLLTVVLALLLVTLSILFPTTSSIGLLYEKSDETRRFIVNVKGRGVPFHTLQLKIDPQHKVDVIRFHRVFNLQPITFELTEPAELGSPSDEALAPWSRIRLPAPGAFTARPVYAVFIVPGPRLTTFLPRDRRTAVRRYYIRVSSGGQQWVLDDIEKSSFVTGAARKDLPRLLDSIVSEALPKRFNGRFGLQLDGASHDTLTTNIEPIGSDLFLPDEKITIEVGSLAKDGRRGPPFAVESNHRVAKSATLALVECNNEECD